jgi:hypothetical protein
VKRRARIGRGRLRGDRARTRHQHDEACELPDHPRISVPDEKSSSVRTGTEEDGFEGCQKE